MTNFILKSLKDRFGNEEDVKGFPDMNYRVGNTSGMDVGNVPSPLDQRIGRMSQLGGSMMEIQIQNPATFQIDRPELINTVNRLGLDMTLHGDPDVGFTTAYATRGQTAGYNTVHRYFKRYMEQTASFKEEVEKRKEQGKVDFEIGYINMHASTAPLPRISQRRPADKAIGPLGQPLEEVNPERSIYRNERFLRKLFDFFLMQEVEQPSKVYQQFIEKSDKFKNEWQEAMSSSATAHLQTNLQEINDVYTRIETLINTVEGAARADQGVNRAYIEKLKDNTYSFSSFTVNLNPVNEESEKREVGNLKELSEALSGPLGGNFLKNIGQLSRDVYSLKDSENISKDEFSEVSEALANLLMEVWREEASVSAKTRALSNTLDIQQRQIIESAEEDIHDTAVQTFSGEADFIEEEKHVELVRDIVGRLGQINSNGAVFFQVVPAWMMTSDHESEGHPGWEAPRFIWNQIVGEEFDSYRELREFIENDRENELNVIAAVGACYIWSHFTQREDEFDTEVFKQTTQEVNKQDFTWVEWMNKFDLKVNLEAMPGDPRQLKRVWRPKDIAIACRAINMTAEKQSKEWSSKYEEPLVKFTIDMEHTASYGVDPVREVKSLIEQEEKLAEEFGEISSEKPLADIVKTYHLTKPGFESRSKPHRHGSFAKGDTTLYRWLYNLVENGFTRNEEDPGIVMFEVGGEYEEDIYTMKVALNMIELGIKPEEVDASKVDPGEDYESKEEALLARFFGMDKPNFEREWSKIEEHAFDPLKGLLEAQDFDYTQSSSAAVNKGNRAGTWNQEEYK